MTTRINVNVDQQALLQRSREQTQATRFGYLEEQRRRKLKAAATFLLNQKAKAANSNTL